MISRAQGMSSKPRDHIYVGDNVRQSETERLFEFTVTATASNSITVERHVDGDHSVRRFFGNEFPLWGWRMTP